MSRLPRLATCKYIFACWTLNHAPIICATQLVNKFEELFDFQDYYHINVCSMFRDITFHLFVFPFISVKINWRQTNLLRHSVPPKCFAYDVQKSQIPIQKKIQEVKILEEKILEKIFIWPWKKSQKDLLWFPMQIWNWFLTKKLIYSNQSKVKNFCLVLLIRSQSKSLYRSRAGRCLQ